MQTVREQPAIVRKEMGITHKEFYGELTALLDGIPYDQKKDTIKFQLNGKKAEIKLGQEGSRKLGRSLQMPVTPVTLRFFDCSVEEINAFIKHFNLKYMKGGG